MYILVPHHNIPADGPLVLGSIISDLSDPESLNEGAVVDIPRDSIRTVHKYNWQDTTESARRGSASVWVHYLNAFLGGSLGGTCDTKTVVHYKISDLETTYFTPNQVYVEDAVNKHKVRTYIEGALYTPLYMITGLKIARGPGSQVTSLKSYGREGQVKTGLSASVAGFPFTVDNGDVTLRQAGVKNTSYGGSSDFVIAYRLGKITFHKTADGSHTLKHEKYTVGAVLGEDDAPSRRESSSKITASVQFDGDHTIAEELRKEKEEVVIAIDEEDNQECSCFVVPPPEGT
jgi:hypothetical protein